MPDKLEQILLNRKVKPNPRDISPETADILREGWKQPSIQDTIQKLMGKVAPEKQARLTELGNNLTAIDDQYATGETPALPRSPFSRYLQEPQSNNPEVQRLLFSLRNATGNSFPDVKHVIAGPDEGVIHVLGDNKLSPYNYPDTNLMGLYSRGKNVSDISINPGLTRSTSPTDGYNKQLFETLVHELTHASGNPSDDESEKVATDAYTQYLKDQKTGK